MGYEAPKGASVGAGIVGKAYVLPSASCLCVLTDLATDEMKHYQMNWLTRGCCYPNLERVLPRSKPNYVYHQQQSDQESISSAPESP